MPVSRGRLPSWRTEQMSRSDARTGTRSGRAEKPNRLEFLDQLVVEFQSTKSKDSRLQVLANLSNFAYDPKNYDYFRRLNILDLFLDNLSERDENLIKFSIGGLCNLCLDPVNKSYITKNGLSRIIKLLERKNEDILLSTVTTLMFLMMPESKAEITSSGVIRRMIKLSREKNERLKNLAAIFLEDYCTKEQVEEASLVHDVSDIPLPES